MNGEDSGVSQTSKSQQGRLARHHIADQDHDKIDKVIVTEAYTSKAYLGIGFFSRSLYVSADAAKAATSPSQDGVEGRDSGTIWMVTDDWD
jgi:hypothetical protein